MNILRHRLLALFLLLVTTVSLQAQIPDEVTFLLRKCAEAMGHPDGVEYEMTIKAKYTVITVMKGQINAFAKDKRNKFFLTMRILDQHTKSAGGFPQGHAHRTFRQLCHHLHPAQDGWLSQEGHDDHQRQGLPLP